ncbi:hypothetical protein ACIRPH_30925 [Nocardiopsis sp. NPDC101807]|uniref:hypothetical protein n=1 Tax=Nocardiopsis sp. NPDC101807 TaxID=3364339 RepID=UPI00381DE8B1
MSPLGVATVAHDTALRTLATVMADAIAERGGSAKEVVEALELLRSQAHHLVDDLIDEEQLRRPPGYGAWRARRYCELRVPTS